MGKKLDGNLCVHGGAVRKLDQPRMAYCALRTRSHMNVNVQWNVTSNNNICTVKVELDPT